LSDMAFDASRAVWDIAWLDALAANASSKPNAAIGISVFLMFLILPGRRSETQNKLRPSEKIIHAPGLFRNLAYTRPWALTQPPVERLVY